MSLKENLCISKSFEKDEETESMAEVVTYNCGYEESFNEDDLQNLSQAKENPSKLTCGNSSHAAGNMNGETERGQWPFLVALYNVELESFFCSGSLITSKHVVTGDK